MPAARESTGIKATLVRGSKSVECQWWLQSDARRHRLKRLYARPISATSDTASTPAIIQGNTFTDHVFVQDRSGVSHEQRIPINEKISHLLSEVFNHLYAVASESSNSVNDKIDSRRSVSNNFACVFLLPEESGFVTRSDFLVYRLLGCQNVASSTSFLAPLAKVSPFLGFIDTWKDVARALESAAGVVLLIPSVDLGVAPQTIANEGGSSWQQSISSLEWELEQRLSFSWLQSATIREYRVGLVIGPQIVRSWLSRWQAAAALGIRLVIFTTENWWPGDQDDDRSLAYLREAIVLIDLSGGEQNGLTVSDRIVKAINTYPHPIDGIFTSSDDYLVSVAQASESLDLYTAGSKPFIVSTDKFYTRMFSGRDIGSTFAVKSMSELENQIGTEGNMGGCLQYPVVCKPSIGRGSEGVFRADSPEELRDAVNRILAIRDCPNGVVVEDYVGGPEVDVNLVLRDGRVLFSEVVDDFPCSADTAASSKGGTFNETQTHTPSGLPQDEQTAAVEAMTQAVLLQGFRSGVFHCEARVRNSAMDYVVDPAVPFPVLQQSATHPSGAKTKPSVFLHEINARAPGMGSSTASLFSSGVDYWALQVLCAVRDWSRFEALSVPVLHAPKNYISLANVAIDVSLAQMRALDVPGFASLTNSHDGPKPDTRIAIDGDAYPSGELRQNRPDIMKYVPYHVTIARPSDWYGGRKGSWRWFTTGVVVSPLNREHALGTVEAFTTSYEELLQEAPKRSAKHKDP